MSFGGILLGNIGDLGKIADLAKQTGQQGLGSGLAGMAGKAGQGFDLELLMASKMLNMESVPTDQDSMSASMGLDTELLRSAMNVDVMVALSKVKEALASDQLQPGQAELAQAVQAQEAAAKAADQAGQAGTAGGPVTAEGASASARVDALAEDVTGALSAVFESGNQSISAIGWDRMGGTSYGKYQIASKTGSMDEFIGYLEKHMPEWAGRLANAGPTDTGSPSGRMPQVWRALAKENPELFGNLQSDFIRERYYQPALAKVGEATGLDLEKFGPAMGEVLWSTAVQHGVSGAADIFGRAAELLSSGSGEDPAKDLINQVYEMRKDRFGSSTEQVQESVRNRFDREMKLALSMLGGPDGSSLA